MEFRLIYEGRLRADGLAKEKHDMRKALHPQLKELWNQHQFLSVNIEHFASAYQKCGFRFVPLVNERQCRVCALDILFLRRDHPGNLVKRGGDIDNRIKTLLDALRMPQDCNELAGAVPDAGEDPFFCLLQDDELITEISVTTDRLLLPQKASAHVNDVLLIIRVKTPVPEELI